MGKASSAKRDRASKAALNPNKSTRTPWPWISVAVIVVVLGVFVIVVSRGSEAVPPLAGNPGDHWHAALGMNVCGDWAPNAPEFEFRNGTAEIRAGIHSHGNGLIHIHPHVSDEAGDNATIGRFFDYGGWDLDETGFSIWTGEDFHNGDRCVDGKPGKLVWSVQHAGDDKPTIQKGNPADYRPKNLDVIAIGFLSEGQELGTPPAAAVIATPGDVPGTPTAPTAPGVTITPPETTGPTTAPGATTPPTTAATGTTAP